jgi:apolipoprotein N-acyltransferase
MSKTTFVLYGMFLALWSLVGLAATGAPTSWIGVGLGAAVAAIAWLRFESPAWRYGAVGLVGVLALQAVHKLHVNWVTQPIDAFGLVFFSVVIAASAGVLVASAIRTPRKPEPV